MTHRPDHLIDLPAFEDGDPGQDASQYGHDDQSGVWVGLIMLAVAFAVGSLSTILGQWALGVLQCTEGAL